MGKKRRSSSGKEVVKNIYRDENPDPESNAFIHDEVDAFHRDKSEIPLSRYTGNQKQSGKRGAKEVLSVRQESSDEDEEELSFDDEDGEDENMDSDLDEGPKDYLPSADAWGKRRKDFYSTDYTGDDNDGFKSSDDEETAKLEEEEAKRLQKKHLSGLSEADFMLEDDLQDEEASTSQEKDVEKPVAQKKSQEGIDLKSLKASERLEYLKKSSPELGALILDYEDKLNILSSQLQPILDFVHKKSIPKNEALELLAQKAEIYQNYLINLRFYFYLQLSLNLSDKQQFISISAHPVIDRITQWRRLVAKIDTVTEVYEQDLLTLTSQLADGTDISSQFSEPQELSLRVSGDKMGREPKVKKSKKKSSNPEDEFGHMFDHDEEDSEEEGEEGTGKRGITYEMAANKGLQPQRKKEQRNPRVKHRKKFKKALIRKRSQIPDAKKELARYGGEERGIRTGLVRSTKLT